MMCGVNLYTFREVILFVIMAGVIGFGIGFLVGDNTDKSVE